MKSKHFKRSTISDNPEAINTLQYNEQCGLMWKPHSQANNFYRSTKKP
jgi:hypothetical protein